MPSSDSLLECYRVLRRHNGSRNWWPGASRFEVIVGAILVQGTGWANAARALEELRRRDWLEPHRMHAVAEADLAETIRCAGTYRQKARKLRSFLECLHGRYEGSLWRLSAEPAARLREVLLGIWGIGPETADCILLYAFGMPTFVVDTYTRRIFERHGWIAPGATYEAVRRFALAELPVNVLVYNDFHAQLVWVGQQYCGPTPRCGGCPLEPWLPKAGCNGFSPSNHAR